MMDILSERERIVKELNKFGFDDTINCCVDVEDVVSWHLAEVKRIVEPLVKLKNEYHSRMKHYKEHSQYRNSYDPCNPVYKTIMAIDETLKRANGGE